MLVDQNNLVQNIISAICIMDVEGLKASLPDHEIYFDMKKSTFIDKISQIFDDLKNRGNTCFSVHPGQCISTICSNTGCTGFAFVSDFTMEHISIVLHYKDEILEDWSHCHELSTGTITLDDKNNIRIHVWEEEKHVFKADDDFLQTITDINQATKMLQDVSIPALTKASLLKWLDKYEERFFTLDFTWDYKNYKSYNSFGVLFFQLLDLAKFFKNEDEIIEVLAEMEYNDIDNCMSMYEKNYLLQQLHSLDLYLVNGEIKLTTENYHYFFDVEDFNDILGYSQTIKEIIP